VKSHLTTVASERTTSQLSNKEIRDTLLKRFDLDNVTHLTAKDIEIARKNGKPVTISVQYTQEQHFLGNLYLLGKFDDLIVEVPGN
jgi:hypothetical protein